MRKIYLPVLLTVLLLAPTARAEEAPKPDDRVVFDLAAEDWVNTKTARVIVSVEAAVSGANAGSTRADMIKAVNALSAADWRLTNFNRNQDPTGLEHWSASFEARLPEASLGGLAESAKKSSKAGMQLTVAEMDFSPTLDEIEAVKSNLRAQIYKKASEQLSTLNNTITGRNFRIATIDFAGTENTSMPVQILRQAVPISMNASVSSDAASVERSEKMRLMAHVVLSAAPAATAK